VSYKGRIDSIETGSRVNWNGAKLYVALVIPDARLARGEFNKRDWFELPLG